MHPSGLQWPSRTGCFEGGARGGGISYYGPGGAYHIMGPGPWAMAQGHGPGPWAMAQGGAGGPQEVSSYKTVLGLAHAHAYALAHATYNPVQNISIVY